MSITDLNSNRNGSISVKEWLTLKDLYDSTNGPGWHYPPHTAESNHWNFTHYSTNDPCNDKWSGIICTCHDSGYDNVSDLTGVDRDSTSTDVRLYCIPTNTEIISRPNRGREIFRTDK